MTHTVEDDDDNHSALLSDRRRADRKDYRNPHLIALLRGRRSGEPRAKEAEAAPEAPADLTSDNDRGGLTSARGIAYGLLFGAVLWALIGLLWYLLW